MGDVFNGYYPFVYLLSLRLLSLRDTIDIVPRERTEELGFLVFC